jgi:hypothetical protein
MKTFIKRIFTGVTEDYQSPTLPDHIIKLQAHPLTLAFVAPLTLT